MESLTFDTFIQTALFIMGFWGFYKVIMEIVAKVTARHDKEQKWDEMADEMVKNVQIERDKIYARYDEKLADMEKQINDNHTDTASKFQQMQTEMYILTECMSAVLDGLKQQGCNGAVTKAKDDLDKYMRERVHGL